jgi:hypothetical protein
MNPFDKSVETTTFLSLKSKTAASFHSFQSGRLVDFEVFG